MDAEKILIVRMDGGKILTEFLLFLPKHDLVAAALEICGGQMALVVLVLVPSGETT